MKRNIKKLSALVVLLFTMNFSLNCQPQNDNGKILKIGWYQSAFFQEGMSDDNPKSGYCYEYLKNIDGYNGWQLEFVYGEWTDLFEKLENGQIDALAGVSKTPERAEKMLFPNYPMGNDYYYLFQHSDTKKMDAADLSTLNGKKIGGVKNNRMTLFVEQWAKENGVNFDMVYYDGFTELDNDFNNYKLDGITATDNNILSNPKTAPVVKVGEEPFYLAVTKNRPDLLADLNKSLDILQSTDPYYLQNLKYKYYGSTVSSSQLTEYEEDWLNNHKTLKIGYMDDYLPFCKSDKNGNTYGILTDVMDGALNALGVEKRLAVEYKPYKSYKEMLSAVTKGEVDAVFPVGGDMWQIEKDGMDSSSTVISSGMALVYRNDYSEKSLNTVSVNRNNSLSYYYVKTNFSESKIIEYNSITECLDAVQKGEVDSTILNGLRENIVRNNSRYNHLSILQLNKSDNRYFGVKDGNSELLLLLNRGIKLIGRDYAANASYKYMNEFYTYNVKDFLKKYELQAVIIFFVIIFIVIFLLAHEIWLTKLRIGFEHNLNKKLETAKIEAENANKAKTTFLFNMSHDIRTPMNAIIGYTELIEKNYDDKAKCMDYLQKMQQSNQFLLSLINNVLEMARIESGKTQLEEKVSPVGGIAREISAIFEDQMKKKGITFIKNVETHTQFAYYDQPKVREIYLNILSNALKYTPEGGTVSMDVKEYPSEKPGEIWMKAVFSDNGIGMSKEFLPHIFEDFTREFSSTESRQQGTGLGMPIVKRIIELMGGTIEVQSEKGKGSTFIVTYPLKTADADPEENPGTAQTQKIDFTGKHILLAEDNDLNAEIASAILTEAGFKVTRAVDGLDCVQKMTDAAENTFDLILMDVQMPNMNGYEATAKIRAMENVKKALIPIVAMTANAYEEDRREAFHAGMNEHIAKPIDVKELMKTLTRVFK